MDKTEIIKNYWYSLVSPDAAKLKKYFHIDAKIFWHNTNELFTADEFIRINCAYPGKWSSELKSAEAFNGKVTTVVRVFSDEASLHAVSFFEISDGKIKRIDEYWSEDGPAPVWRRQMKIGNPIVPVKMK